MVSRIRTTALQGVSVIDITVEVQLSAGLPAFTIVGLPDKAVAESRERVRAALTAIGLSLPPKRITVNLAPADILKEGSHFDLPIALGLMAAVGVLDVEDLDRLIAVGEVSLDGRLCAVPGVLPTAVHTNACDCSLVCPKDNGAEAAWAGGQLPIIAAESLLDVVGHLKGHHLLPQPEAKKPVLASAKPDQDLRDIRGQESAKRALEIAAAGGHNLLMTGPPGAGKSMLAARLPGLLPELTTAEALEISLVRSVAGELTRGSLSFERPFRAPHHSSSMAALVGGGSNAKPGEVSLAHTGVLFLDELPEFGRQALDALRAPMETGETTVARANRHITYPSRVQVIAAMNPCKCGHLADPDLACRKAPKCAQDYQARVSGPILDRMDLHIDVPAVSALDLALPPPTEGSKEVADRVADARDLQRQRYGATGPRCNAEADGDTLQAACQLNAEAQSFLQTAAEHMKLSARGYHRVLRVARTIADLAGQGDISQPCIAEAVSYRRSSITG